MNTRRSLIIGDVINLGGFMKPFYFTYTGIVNQSFSVGILTNIVRNFLNFYYPINSEYIQIQNQRIKIIEVTPEKLVIEID